MSEATWRQGNQKNGQTLDAIFVSKSEGGEEEWMAVYDALVAGGELTVEIEKSDYARVAKQLLFSGFADITQPSDTLVKCRRPNWTLDAVPLTAASNNNPKKDSNMSVWTLQDNDLTELEDEDAILDKEQDKPQVTGGAGCGVERGGAGQRKACKNCTCGLAEEMAASEGNEDQQASKRQKAMSGCGSCGLGDAFRCSTCPFLGKPPFKHTPIALVDGKAKLDASADPDADPAAGISNGHSQTAGGKPNQGEKQKGWVLHVDVNGTVTALDTTDDHTPRMALNQMLSKLTFGTLSKGPNGLVWKQDPNGITSYYDYLGKVNPNEYKDVTTRFAEKGEFGEFRHHELQLALPRWVPDGFFQSFHKLLDKLTAAPRHVQVVFRTFGLDGELVAKWWSVIAPTWGFAPTLRFGKWDGDELVMADGHRFKNVVAFTEYLAANVKSPDQREALLLVENYQRWKANSKAAEFGKHVHGHSQLVQLCFDDNPCFNAKGENVHFFRVDTLQAITDDHYFVNLLQRAKL